jgi:hypothetical protein
VNPAPVIVFARRGLWLDTSDQTPEQTVGEILARMPEARWDPDG